ncbi:hypothetical protein AVEN_194575-1 [Araneus ventricosus]|uniref:Uncharacterized protein n=1 Tax=Araneus ventricosus TaxID=182803 RepID=A0A4Y2A6I2_ARAVE|nr:hypothetical protein AVEN_194575-1 [Araneus ventricosus]
MPPLSITKAYSTTSTDVLHVLSGCPPLDLKVRADVMTSQHIQRINNSREFGGLQSFDFEMAREPCLTHNPFETRASYILFHSKRKLQIRSQAANCRIPPFSKDTFHFTP